MPVSINNKSNDIHINFIRNIYSVSRSTGSTDWINCGTKDFPEMVQSTKTTIKSSTNK